MRARLGKEIWQPNTSRGLVRLWLSPSILEMNVALAVFMTQVVRCASLSAAMVLVLSTICGVRWHGMVSSPGIWDAVARLGRPLLQQHKLLALLPSAGRGHLPVAAAACHLLLHLCFSKRAHAHAPPSAFVRGAHLRLGCTRPLPANPAAAAAQPRTLCEAGAGPTSSILKMVIAECRQAR